MSVLYNSKGQVEIKPHKKKTFQGDSVRTKTCARGSRPRRKASRGQGK